MADLALSVDASDEALFGGATLADIWDRGTIYASDPMCAAPTPPHPTLVIPHSGVSTLPSSEPKSGTEPVCHRRRRLTAFLPCKPRAGRSDHGLQLTALVRKIFTVGLVRDARG